MKLTYEQLLDMLEESNRLHDLFWSIQEYEVAKRYWAVGNRILRALSNPINKFV